MRCIKIAMRTDGGTTFQQTGWYESNSVNSYPIGRNMFLNSHLKPQKHALIEDGETKLKEYFVGDHISYEVANCTMVRHNQVLNCYESTYYMLIVY